MPELPEVETTRRGITPHVVNRAVTRLIIRQRQLRWPVPDRLEEQLIGQQIQSVQRRAKYLLLGTTAGTLILHLGMSGNLRILPADVRPGKHDHIDWVLDSRRCLRLHDPRRFGAVLWTTDNPYDHPLLATLGPEPLGETFSGDWLYHRAKHRKSAIKLLIMDGRSVAGVGNIYANEALFLAGIHPKRSAGRVSRKRCQKLSESIRWVLADAIKQGGTTLRDFIDESGRPGYFQHTLRVYGRAGERCPRCPHTIRAARIGQRSTFYCPHCQT